MKDTNTPQDSNAPHDPFEDRLKRLHPRPVSDRLRSRIGAELSRPTVQKDQTESADQPDQTTPPVAPVPVDPPTPLPLTFPRTPQLWWGLAACVLAAVSIGWFAAIDHSLGPVALNPPIPGAGAGPHGHNGVDQASVHTETVSPAFAGLSADVNTTASLIRYTRAAIVDEAALDKMLDNDARKILQPQSPAQSAGKPMVY